MSNNAHVGGGGIVTLLFTDLVASTELFDRLGDDRAEEIRRDHFNVLREAAAEHGGEVVKSLGDGLMLAFSGNLQALACAAAIQQATAARNRDSEHQLGVRVGINVGEVVADEDDYFGTTVVIAKRLCDRAEGGQVLVSDLVRNLAGTRGGHRFADLGFLRLKGFADPLRTHELRWIGDTELDREASGAPGPEGAPAPAPQMPLPPGLARAAETRFVGRADALAALEREFARTAVGERRMVLLAGEPGVGKTRLSSELATGAREQGALVLFGHSDEETLVPFQPFIEAIAHYAEHASAGTLREDLGDSGRELLRLIPGLRRRVPELDEPESGDPESERYRMFEAITHFLSSSAQRSPVVLILDDLHWADRPSLLLLRHILRAPTQASLLIIGTYRDVELSRTHPFAEALADLRRERLFEKITLGGLSEAEVAELVAAWAGQPAPPGFAKVVWSETEGHPFFVQEILRHLLETGAIYEDDGRMTTRISVEKMGIPEGIKDVVTRRLARLDESTEDLLAVAAVAGREFSADVLERVGEHPGARTLAMLEEAVAARVIEEVSGAVGRYRFSHALFRETLYERLTRARRTKLHVQVGEALEGAETEAAVLAELAHHFFEAASRSEELDKAIAYATAAGDRAAEQLAYEEAASHYERAVRGLELQHTRDEKLCELLLSLGANAWNAGDFLYAKDSFSRAAELAAELGLDAALGRAALGFGGRMGFDVGIVDADLIALLERSLERLGDDQPALRSRTLARLAEALAFAGPDTAERRAELCEEALELATRVGDGALIAGVLGHINWALTSPDDLEESEARSNRMVALADAAGVTLLRMEGRLWRVMCGLRRGDMEAMRRDMAVCDELAEEFHDSYYTWMVEMGTAMRLFATGDVDEGERLARQALETGQLGQNPTAMQLFGIQMFHLRLPQGGLLELHAGAKSMAEHFTTIPAYRCALAAIYSELGLLDEARREFELLAADDFSQLPRDLFWLNCLDYLSYPCEALGDASRAERLHELLRPYAHRFVVGGAAGFVQGCLGRPAGVYATVAGRLDEAVDLLTDALEANSKAGLPHAIAETQIDLARARILRSGAGDAEVAAELLDSAGAAAARVGFGRLEERAAELRAQLARGAEGAAGRAAEDVRNGQGRIGRLASHAGSDIRAALSVRGRAAMARVLEGASDEELERRFGSVVAQRAMLGAMARAFQPRMALGFQGNVLLELTRPPDAETGQASNWWTIQITSRKASVRHRTTDDPALTVHCSVPDFVRIFSGQTNTVAAWVQGRLRVDGDPILGTRLTEMFGAVKPFEAAAATD